MTELEPLRSVTRRHAPATEFLRPKLPQEETSQTTMVLETFSETEARGKVNRGSEEKEVGASSSDGEYSEYTEHAHPFKRVGAIFDIMTAYH